MLLFLKDLGTEDTQLGPFLTKNYAIFSEDLENLKTRVAYLQSKNFSKADIAQMVRNAPLGFFQKELELSVKKTRDLVIRLPRLLTGSLEPVKENLKVFNTRLFKVKERHLFLAYLGRAQYDPTKPDYICLDTLVSVPDGIFCEGMAKASLQDFEKFLKTL
uniref:Mitochondrial transcription termination factor 3 n=1 Tax=Capra hircus TaxID=9925 RepID=A0A8C2S1Y6_CAPHI